MKQIKFKLWVTMTIIMVACLFPHHVHAQFVSYRLLGYDQVSSSIVRLSIIVYGKDKKTIDADAMKVALNVAMFDGISGSSFSKPLLDDGLNTSMEKYPEFFNDFYNYRYEDFIQSCNMISKFKKADKNKGTHYSIEIKILNLRKDLEKNQIRKKLGI